MEKEETLIDFKATPGNLIDITLSFSAAMQQAKGSVPDKRFLENLSALELLKMLANNNIRFVYTSDND